MNNTFSLSDAVKMACRAFCWINYYNKIILASIENVIAHACWIYQCIVCYFVVYCIFFRKWFGGDPYRRARLRLQLLWNDPNFPAEIWINKYKKMGYKWNLHELISKGLFMISVFLIATAARGTIYLLTFSYPVLSMCELTMRRCVSYSWYISFWALYTCLKISSQTDHIFFAASDCKNGLLRTGMPRF